MTREEFGEESQYSAMFGGLFVLLAAWGLGGNLLLCAILAQNKLWTLINRGLVAISMVGIFQSILCIFPKGLSGIRRGWNFSDPWCYMYPFFTRFSQMTVMWLVVLLLIYNILSVKHEQQIPPYLSRLSFWAPGFAFLLPYITFLPPALMFLGPRGVTALQEDRSVMYVCTVIPDSANPHYSSYITYRSIETIVGFVVPYLTVIALFVYLVLVINRRKISKQNQVTDLFDSYSDTSYNTADGGATREREGSPLQTLQSLSARSDKQTEVVVYALAASFILFFSPLVYGTLRELFSASYVTVESDGVVRLVTLFLSHMVILVYPTLYTLQYPTIRESLNKRNILKHLN